MTALALIFLLVVPQARGGGELAAFGRRIPDHYLRKTLALVSVAALLVVSGAVAIMISEGWGFLPALFHSTSALGTVGFSVRSSAELGAFGKLLLILIMFVGRLGPITFLVALSSRTRSRSDDHPPGNIAVGRTGGATRSGTSGFGLADRAQGMVGAHETDGRIGKT